MMTSPCPQSPLEVPSKAWANFVQEDYIPIVLEAQELGKMQDPENEPFKSKYLAIEKLSNLRHQGAVYSRADGLLSAAEKAECKDMLAMLDVKRGTLALDTEDPSLAEKLLTSATHQLKVLEERNVEALQDAYNLLGVIWSNRDEQKKAEAYLLEAEQLYHKYCTSPDSRTAGHDSITAAVDTGSEPLKPSAPASSSSQAGSTEDKDEPEQLEGAACASVGAAASIRNEHEAGPTQQQDLESGISTQLAEASISGAPALDTTASSNRDPCPKEADLESGSLKLVDAEGTVKGTGRSAEKLEFLYTMTAFYLAQVYGHSREQDKMAEYLGITLDRQLRMGHNFEPLEWAQNCAQLSGYFVQRGDYETAVHCLTAAGVVLERAGITVHTENGGDVVANVLIGYGKLHMQVIGNSRTLFANAAENEDPPESSPAPAVLQDRSNLQPPANGKAPASKAPPHLEEPQGGQVPGRRKLRFASLDLPSMDALSGCDAKGAVHSYEDAVKQFNKAMTAFKGALEYYKLDGHVTEHCNILFDISALHKYLAFLEPSEGRICQLHKRRATRLEPLASALNPSAFSGIWRQLTYELASINQEIVDVRLANSRPFSKYGAAAKDAVKYYTLYLKSFQDVKGNTPDKMEEAEEADYLLAQVQLAMVYYKLYNRENEDRKLEDLLSSLELYNSFLNYVKRHQVKGMDERVRVCREMAELLPTKISAEQAGRR